MEITRVINGVEHVIELTHREMYDAFCCVELENTKEDVLAKAEDLKIAIPADKLDRIARGALHGLGNTDAYYEIYWYAIENEIEYVLSEDQEGRG